MLESEKKVKVTVVIPSLAHKTQDYLKVCVESLRKTVDWDIIVVTNGASVRPNLSDIHGITRHLHTSEQGQCVAVNIGVNAAAPDTDYILVSNDDMYYAPYWNRNLKFEHLVFSPNLVEPTSGPGSAPPFLTMDGGFILDEFSKFRVNDYVYLHTGKNNPDNIEEGFNLPFFVAKHVMQSIGGYDENYDPWGSNSDSDLQAKFHLAGITPKRVRDLLVYHFSNKSGTFDGTHQDAWQKNWDYFTDKWGFNRDQLGSDVWYGKDILPEDENSIKYQPEWRGKYGPGDAA